MNYTISHFSLIVLGYPWDPNRSSCPNQTFRCPGACDFPLLFCRSAPSTFPDTWSTLKGPFWGVPSHRLYSEIDQIHLSSEAQCVSHHLPLVDCHILQLMFPSKSLMQYSQLGLNLQMSAIILSFLCFNIYWYETEVIMDTLDSILSFVLGRSWETSSFFSPMKIFQW